VSTRSSLGGLVVRAIRRPGSAIRAARTQKLKVFLLVTDALPDRVRRSAFRAFGAGATMRTCVSFN
jgi:hypothetical protein